MKKIVLLLFVVAQIGFVTAQSLVVTGDTVVTTIDPCLTTQSYLTVKNISSDSLNVICEKTIIYQEVSATNYFCWGGNCYGASTMISPSKEPMAAGLAVLNSFGGYFDAYCDTDSAVIQYCFYPDTDITDKSCITITYNGNLATTAINGIHNMGMNEFYPNPADEYVSFDYNVSGDAALIVIDILGNEVKKVSLSESGRRKVYVGDLSKGVYFGNLIVGSEVISIKKMIKK